MRKWQHLLRMNRKALMECVDANKDRERLANRRRQQRLPLILAPAGASNIGPVFYLDTEEKLKEFCKISDEEHRRAAQFFAQFD